MTDKKLPDCSLEPNKSIVADVFENSYRHEISTLASFECGCSRPCQKNFQDKPSGKDFASLNFKVVEESFVRMTEINVYKVSELLADFGGNLGFSLGFSLLSVIEIVHMALLILYKYIRPVRLETNIKKKVIAQINLSKRKTKTMLILPQNNRKVVRTLYYILIFTSALVAIYVSKERITLYLSEPTRFVVFIQENDTLHLPNVIACMDGLLMTKYRKQYAKEIGMNECKIHFIDLMNATIRKKNPSIEDVWRYQTPRIDKLPVNKAVILLCGPCYSFNPFNPHSYSHCIYRIPPERTACRIIMLGVKDITPWNKVNMTTGTCFESDIDQICTPDEYEMWMALIHQD
uniref:Uncharacterized protein n=1 Tax=Strigamia maritima TaxID=126957 RepID=T1ITA9_STRMM